MNAAELATCTGAAPGVAARWLDAIVAAMARWEINTPARQAAFLAQIGVESDHLRGEAENLNYAATALRALWPSHFSEEMAQEYGRTEDHPANQEMIANIAYANRMGNGDPASGDGWLFRGRPLLGETGRANYRLCGAALGLDLEANPDLLMQPEHAAAAAGWFWRSHGCNELADGARFVEITHRINGGLTGYSARVALWSAAKKVLHV